MSALIVYPLSCLLVVSGIGFAQAPPAVTETVLHNFASPAQGANPYSTLVRDSSGNFYGTAVNGGPHGAGVVFKLDASGQTTILYNFTGKSDGATPLAGVILDASGDLYGTTFAGGASNQGTVYKLDPAGNETVLYSFTGGVDGGAPHSVLTMGRSGNLYGTTQAGGAVGGGVVFRVSATGVETVIHSFTSMADGGLPESGVILDSSGNLYGTALIGGSGFEGVVYKIDSKGALTTLYNFTGGADGGEPVAGLIRDAAGNLYGTTSFGGASFGGVVYKLSPSGQETVLYNFTGGLDGGDPQSGLIRDPSGNLYGTTFSGGLLGNGVVYKLDAKGKETVLESFRGDPGGAHSFAGVTPDGTGNLYGATNYGGSYSYGVVFKIDTAGQESVIHNFAGLPDGAYPEAGVTMDSAGNLYGTTGEGGANGLGTVYKLDSQENEIVLYSFTICASGCIPESSVVLDSAGNIYGTTISGGNNFGVVYKVDQSGNETVLHAFTGGADGGNPIYAGVILDAEGNLYGTTQDGGANNDGVVYRITPTGVESVLRSFDLTDGANPLGGVIASPSGTLYGTTAGGGKNGTGVVFEITTGAAR